MSFWLQKEQFSISVRLKIDWLVTFSRRLTPTESNLN